MDVFRFVISLILVFSLSPAFSADDDPNDITDTVEAIRGDLVNSCRSECGELEPGQCRKPISCAYNESKSNKAAFYEICKTAKNKLVANLNVTFFQDDPNGGFDPEKIRKAASVKGSSEQKVDKKWRKKAQKCIDRFRSRLTDGKRSLNVRLYPASSSKGSSNILIDVESNAKRNTDVTWRHDIGCETIIHEIGHHLGLCDEYSVHGQNSALISAPPSGKKPEKGMFNTISSAAGQIGKFLTGGSTQQASMMNWGRAGKKSCRSVGSPESLMRDPDMALNGRKKISFYWCRCNNIRGGDLSSCKPPQNLIQKLYISQDSQDLMNTIKPNVRQSANKGCPPGFTAQRKTIYRGQPQTIEGFRNMLWDKQVEANKNIFNSKKQGFRVFPVVSKVVDQNKSKGALQPYHLDSIEYPIVILVLE